MHVKLCSFSTKNSVLSAYLKFAILLFFTSSIVSTVDIPECLHSAATAAQSGRNKKQLENFLDAAQEIHLKRKQQMIGCVPGDIMIGVLLPVHEHSFTKNESYSFLKCGTEINFNGMLLIEDFFELLAEFNEMFYKELENNTLGMYIMDHCNSEIVAQYQVIRLLEFTYLRNDSNQYFQDFCPTNIKRAPLIGIVDQSTELRITESTGTLLTSLQVPFLFSGSSLITDFQKHIKSLTQYTFADNFIIFYILEHFKWTYITLIYTEDYYDLKLFESLAKFYNVCIAKRTVVYTTHLDDYYQDLVQELSATNKAKVVISFCRGSTVNTKLFHAMGKMKQVDGFVLISSAEWLPENFRDMSKGWNLPQILVFHRTLMDFPSTGGYFNVSDDLGIRNPWLKEYVQRKYNCTFRQDAHSNESLEQLCTGRQFPRENHAFLKPGVTLLTQRELVMVKLLALLWDLKDNVCFGLAWENCYDKHPLESMMDIDNEGRILSYCSSIYIDEGLHFISIDKNRNISFEIWTYREPEFIRIGEGHWNYSMSRVQMTTAPRNETNQLKRIESKCSDPCLINYKKIFPNSESPCCWICVPVCSKRMIIHLNITNNNDTRCTECKDDEWPNEDQTKCEKLPVLQVEWKDPELVISSIYATTIIILAAMSTVIFFKHRQTPVVKSTSRELSFPMLIAIIVVNCIAFVKVAGCTKFTCSFTRVLLTTCLATIYGALLVRTVRIARLLALSKNKFPALKLRWMSTKSQVVATILIVILQIIIVFIGLHLQPVELTPSYKYCRGPRPNAIKYVCDIDEKFWLFDCSLLVILVLLSTACAIWTRNVPDNFNEAKYIGFLMYSTCITWLGFALIYFNTEYKIITLCICTSTNSLIILVLLFFPKLYILIWKPEKNDKRFFSTSTGIRAHVGNVVTKRTSLTRSSFTEETLQI